MLKSALVLPALALFLFSFNTKEVYVPDASDTSLNWSVVDDTQKIEIRITKDTSDSELEKIKQDMAKDGVDFSYTVVRNSNKEIIDLSVDMNANPDKGKQFRGSSSFDNDGEPIDPVTIVFDPDGTLMFMGGGDDMVFDSKSKGGKMTWFMEEDESLTEEEKERLRKEGADFIIITEDLEDSTDEEENVTKKTWVKKGGDNKDGQRITVKIVKRGDVDDDVKFIGKKIVIKDGEEIMELHEGEEHEKHIEVISSKGGKGKNVFIMKDSGNEEDIEIIEGEGEAFFFMDSEKGEKPLYIVDGKEVNEKKFKSISPKDIVSVNVWKGEKAIKKYGKKAKDGVVEVITKKE